MKLSGKTVFVKRRHWCQNREPGQQNLRQESVRCEQFWSVSGENCSPSYRFLLAQSEAWEYEHIQLCPLSIYKVYRNRTPPWYNPSITLSTSGPFC
ncbi:hypothetical protein RRG08_041989 [Elysia crispata]|uniref:Uncharacterized protein n=1 Tax=Elysia crispata TaxID=231223 RepID=A0AAE0YZK4_9GAST|nr:hypothetical protein RRG08_041989 [Elysia crispata]